MHRTPRYPRSLWCVVLLSASAPALSQGPGQEFAQDAVEKGKQALAPFGGGYPWYDDSKDAPKSIIPPKEPEQPSNTDGRWAVDLLNAMIDALMILAMVILVGFLVWLILRIEHKRRGERTQGDDDLEAEVDQVDALPVPVKRVTDFLKEAQRLVELGDYRHAIIYYYAHQLLMLDRHGVVRLAKGKTNRRYLREVSAAAPELHGLMQRTVVLFEDAFFGDHPIDEAEFLDVWQQRDRFEEGRTE